MTFSEPSKQAQCALHPYLHPAATGHTKAGSVFLLHKAPDSWDSFAGI